MGAWNLDLLSSEDLRAPVRRLRTGKIRFGAGWPLEPSSASACGGGAPNVSKERHGAMGATRQRRAVYHHRYVMGSGCPLGSREICCIGRVADDSPVKEVDLAQPSAAAGAGSASARHSVTRRGVHLISTLLRSMTLHGRASDSAQVLAARYRSGGCRWNASGSCSRRLQDGCISLRRSNRCQQSIDTQDSKARGQSRQPGRHSISRVDDAGTTP